MPVEALAISTITGFQIAFRCIIRWPNLFIFRFLFACVRLAWWIWFVSIVSSRVSVPPWNIDLTSFYLDPPQKINSKSVRPPFYDQSLLKMLENLTPTLPHPPPRPSSYTVPSSKKANTYFLKKQNILFPIIKWNTFELWNMNIQLQNLKMEGELGLF